MSTAPSRLQVAAALAAVYVLWGSTYCAIVVALPGYPPFLLTAVRMAIAGALMLAVLRMRGAVMPTRAQWRNPRLEFAVGLHNRAQRIRGEKSRVKRGKSDWRVAHSVAVAAWKEPPIPLYSFHSTLFLSNPLISSARTAD